MRPAIDPAEAGDLLRWLKHGGFGAWLLVDEQHPALIVLFRQWAGSVDVVHVRGGDRVEAARMPYSNATDIFRPEKIVWHYFGGVVAALSALQRLIEGRVGSGMPLYAPPRDGDPLPLYATDDELRAKKAYYPPSVFPVQQEGSS